MINRINKRKYKKRTGKPRGPYTKTVIKKLLADLYKKNGVLLITAGILKPIQLQLPFTTSWSKFRITYYNNNPEILFSTTLANEKIKELAFNNQKNFPDVFIKAIKNDKYNELIPELDRLTHHIREWFFKTKINADFFHIENEIVVTNSSAYLITDIELFMLHEHLKFFNKTTNQNSKRYVLYGDVIVYKNTRLEMKPIYIERDRDLKNKKLVNKLASAVLTAFNKKKAEYAKNAMAHINKSKIITTAKQSKNPEQWKGFFFYL